MRLLIACQDSGIYIFETWQGPTGTASNDLPCQELFIGREEAEGALNEQDLSAPQREVQHLAQIRQTRSHGVAAGQRRGVLTFRSMNVVA